MPLIKPDIQSALRSAGLAAPAEASINDILSRNGASLEDTIVQLIELSNNASSDSVRLKAIEDALKLRGVLKEQAPPPPSVTIVIQDPNALGGINPVLLPRELSQTSPVQPSASGVPRSGGGESIPPIKETLQ